MNFTRPTPKPPPTWQLALELRLLPELAQCMARSVDATPPAPQGDGHSVMVLPGFFADDSMLQPLVSHLRRAGYNACTWGLGRNRGIRRGLRHDLARQLDNVAKSGAVSLVGWSLGGVFARELARAAPNKVRHVITLGSPIRGHPASNNLNTLFKWVTGKDGRSNVDWDAVDARALPPPGVPCTAIHSKSDGIVAWECSTEQASPLTRNIEVRSSHFGLPYKPSVMNVITQALAQPPGYTAA